MTRVDESRELWHCDFSQISCPTKNKKSGTARMLMKIECITQAYITLVKI